MCLIGCFTGIEKSDDDSDFAGGNDVDRDPPDHIKDIIAESKAKNSKTLRQHFVGAVIMMFVLKIIGMAAAIIFAAADMVQFLGGINFDFPDTKINGLLDTLGSDVGYYKFIPIGLSIICNIVLHDSFIVKYLDKNKSSWEIVGLEFLYFIVELIDNYAGLCLGNVSQYLYEQNPAVSFVLALMFGQLYNSDLWVVIKVVVPLFTCVVEGMCCYSYCAEILFLCILAPLTVILLFPIIISQIIPSIVDTFALPFSFFFVMFGINIDEDKYEFDRRNGDEEDAFGDKVEACECKCTSNDHNSSKYKHPVLRVAHKIFQLIFMLGLLFFLDVTKKKDNEKLDLFKVLTICMFVVVCGGIIVVLLDLFGA